jgi:hypothetical protein
VSQANETATAQQIKGQYAGLRLGAMQDSVALYATDLLRKKAEVMCSKFQPKTLLSYAAADQFSEEDKQLIPQALQLLKDKPLRTFRVEVAADSLVQVDEAQMKKDRTEFMTAFAGFMQQAVPAGQQVPQLAPMLMEVLKFGVSAFKGARQIEGAIDTGIDQLKQLAAQNAANPKPDPEALKLQAEQAKAQIRAQTDTQIAVIQAEAKATQQQAAHDHEAQLAAMEHRAEEAFGRWKAELDAAKAVIVALIGAKMTPDGSMGLELAMSMDEMIAGLDHAAPQTMPMQQLAAPMPQFPMNGQGMGPNGPL